MSVLLARGLGLLLATATGEDILPAGPPPDAVVLPPLPPARGFEIGAGLDYSLPAGPLGVASQGLGTHLSNLETASVPLSLEAGYLFSGWLFLGGELLWGPGVAPNSPSPCQSSRVGCSEGDFQALAVTRFYFAPHARTTGWFGLAMGWELARFASSVGSSTTTATYSGPVLVDARLGFEVRSRPVAIAPYLGVAFGEYVTRGLDPASPPVPTWMATALHEWVTLGIRGTYGPL